MEILYEQMGLLIEKVNALYGIIDKLSEDVTHCQPSHQSKLPVCANVAEGVLKTTSLVDDVTVATSRYRSAIYQRYNSLGTTMELEHKDVLLDDNHLENSRWTQEKELSPEIQIQRLTAQLTAAYNRIAALEEQLLAVKRIS